MSDFPNGLTASAINNTPIGATTPAAGNFTTLSATGNVSISGASALRGSYGGGGVASNFASGDGALFSNTTGSYNTASGVNSLYSNTTGHNNTASGREALLSNTIGNNNTASGGYALQNNTTGNYNTASGQSALFSNTTGSYNTASGLNALLSNTTGYYNTASGYAALYSNTTGYSNTASGRGALYSNTTGSGNVALGYYAGFYETGSNFFYVDNQDRTNTAGDKTKALLYGTFATTAAAQQLTANVGTFTVTGALSATSLSVGADICWTQSTDTYSRSSGLSAATQVVTDIHANMRRCVMRDDGTVAYYLSPTNSALQEDGVTASVLTGADGQVMVEIPATYVKFTPGATRKWAISMIPAPGYELYPAFMKDGVFVPYRYRGAYDACFYDVSGAAYLDGFNWDINPTVDATATIGDKLASVSGKYPLVGVTRAQCRVLAANRGPGWRVNDYWLDELIKLLFIVEYGTFNAQAKLGDGNSAGSYVPSSGVQTDSPHSVAGKSNSLGNASTNITTGASSAVRDTAFMSYRGIENWYGNCWQFVDGLNINNGQCYVSNVRANFADDTATGYDILGIPNVATSGWQTDIQQLPLSFLPSAVGGGSSSYLADYYWYAAGWKVLLAGADAGLGSSAGPFAWYASSASSGVYRNVSARLAY